MQVYHPPSVDEGSWALVKWSIHQTNRYFLPLCRDISFCLLVTIAVFLPLWLTYIQQWGADHFVVKVFGFVMNASLGLVSIIMVGFYLFNRTHPQSQALQFWSFTRETTWPLLVEGLKASVIILAGCFLFIIPGIIKQIHFMFVIYVIFFNRLYREGKISALKYSKDLSRGLRWWLLLFLGLHLLLEYPVKVGQNLLEMFSQTGYVQYPVLMALLYLTALAMVYLCSLLYFVYVARDKNSIPAPAEAS